MQTEEKLKIIEEASYKANGIDTKIIDIRSLSNIADYFVIVSGHSSIQVKSISEKIDKDLYENGIILEHKEGYDTNKWILLDYGDIIVHIFHEEYRDYYNLERIWD